MFGRIGLGELVLILVIALVIFGPKKLPEMGRAIGEAIREFQKASRELTRSLTEEPVSENKSSPSGAKAEWPRDVDKKQASGAQEVHEQNGQGQIK